MSSYHIASLGLIWGLSKRVLPIRPLYRNRVGGLLIDRRLVEMKSHTIALDSCVVKYTIGFSQNNTS